MTLALLLLACTSTTTVPDDTGDTGTADDTGTGLPQWTGSVDGCVMDQAGNGIADLQVTLCDEICRLVKTDSNGAFSFVEVGPGQPVLESFGYPGDSKEGVKHFTRFYDFVPIEDGEQITLERPRVLYAVDDSTGPLTGEQTYTGNGLTVSFDADHFGSPGNPLPPFATEVWFGSVEIAPEDWPQNGLQGWEPVRVWAFAEWDLHHEDGFQVTAELGLAEPLPLDTEVAWLVADYTYGFQNGIFWVEEAELVDGNTLRTPASAGLDRATLWVAAKKAAR